jgi:hypothetical protein
MPASWRAPAPGIIAFSLIMVHIPLRQRIQQLHRLRACGDYPQEQFHGMLAVAHGCGDPETGIVGDAAVLVGGGGLAADDAIRGGGFQPPCLTNLLGLTA